MKDYMGLYSQIIKKVTRGGPHRVAGKAFCGQLFAYQPNAKAPNIYWNYTFIFKFK